MTELNAFSMFIGFIIGAMIGIAAMVAVAVWGD